MANSFQNEQEAPELVTIAELAERIVFRLPGCSDVAIRKTIQEVYREFCRETQCLTANRAIPLVSGCARYPVVPVFGGVVGEVRKVRIGNGELVQGRDYVLEDGTSKCIVLNRSFLPTERRSGENTPDGAIVSYSPVVNTSVPADKRVMVVTAYEFPKVGSESAPSWFVEKHGDAIVSGVMARLCAMSGRAWSDAQVAAEERIRYENFKSEARMEREVPKMGRFIDTSMTL